MNIPFKEVVLRYGTGKLIQKRRQFFSVVLFGTPSGKCLGLSC